jgi:hypothetical protein
MPEVGVAGKFLRRIAGYGEATGTVGRADDNAILQPDGIDVVGDGCEEFATTLLALPNGFLGSD